MKKFRIAMAGAGTVACGLAKLITNNAEHLANRTNRQWEIVAYSARDRNKERPGMAAHNACWEDNVTALLNHQPDAVVELIGGTDGAAKQIVTSSLGAGFPVVTANKALVAAHAMELARMAEQQNTVLRFEGAVAGAIPVVKVLRESLSGNQVSEISAILNGTSNYILSQMSERGLDFKAALRQAQEQGYAEQDPGMDVDGTDSAAKLSILATIAFSCICPLAQIEYEGITNITSEDIKFAQEMGYVFRLIATAKQRDDDLLLDVAPLLVPIGSPMAATVGVDNAIKIEANYAGTIILEGAGAGAKATASSVAADLMAIALGRSGPPFGVSCIDFKPGKINLTKAYGSWLLCLRVVDKSGVLALITKQLAEYGISIKLMTQHTKLLHKPGASTSYADIVLQTYPTKQQVIETVLAALRQHTNTVQSIKKFRILEEEPPKI